MKAEASAMRVAIVNPVWDASIAGPAATLDRFATLTGWADAVAAAGAHVTVHQRFSASASLDRGGVPYTFVEDGEGPVPSQSGTRAKFVARSVLAANPQLVHVNGVVFPEWLRALRRELPRTIRLVVQDHGGWEPAAASSWSRLRIRRGLAAADGVLVSSPGHASAWRRAGVIPSNVPVVDVMEASAGMMPMPRHQATALSGVSGDPAVLSVGRLIASKDPLTLLDGFAQFLSLRPKAGLTMVYNAGDLQAQVHERIARDPAMTQRVRMVGAVPPDQMAAYYSAADIYVSASHREGSGYAAIEAMACGATPVLTRIPSFRVLTGEGTVGPLWQKGQPQSLCDALLTVASEPRGAARARVRARFESALTWPVLGRRALEIYRDVCAR